MKNRSYIYIDPLKAQVLFFHRKNQAVFIPAEKMIGVGWLKYLLLGILLMGGVIAGISSEFGRAQGWFNEDIVVLLILIGPLLGAVALHLRVLFLNPLCNATHFLILREENALVGLLLSARAYAPNWSVQMQLEGMHQASKDKAHVIAKNLRQKNLKLPRFYYKMDPANKKKIPDEVYELSEIDWQWDFRPTRTVKVPGSFQ